MASTLVHGGSPERNARPRSAESTQQNRRGLLQRGLLHARPQTQCQKSLALSRINGGSPERNARPRSAESTGHRPAHIPPLSLGLHRPGPHWHLRPLSLGPRPLRRTTEDHEFIGSDIDLSTQLVINYKHHRIGSSLPSPNISRAAPRSYAYQSHVYTSSGWSRRSRR
jgi:hypothetical protein